LGVSLKNDLRFLNGPPVRTLFILCTHIIEQSLGGIPFISYSSAETSL